MQLESATELTGIQPWSLINY